MQKPVKISVNIDTEGKIWIAKVGMEPTFTYSLYTEGRNYEQAKKIAIKALSKLIFISAVNCNIMNAGNMYKYVNEVIKDIKFKFPTEIVQISIDAYGIKKSMFL